MNIISKLLNFIKYYTYQYLIGKIKYKSFTSKYPYKICNPIETVNYIIVNRVSVSRFGDGEFDIINNKDTYFEKKNELLSKRLIEVLNSDLDNHIVCIPYYLANVDELTLKAKIFWRTYCYRKEKILFNLLNTNRKYFDASFTRFYIDKNNKQIEKYIILLKKIWENKNLYIIEGEYSCLGVGNDLFNNAKSIHRILAPSNNAFSKYDKIYQTAITTIPKNSQILIALGMTATILAYDLAKNGYWAIDVGHIDVEYCWYKMNAKKKCPVPGKSVNESNKKIPDITCQDKSYLESIIAKIE